MRTEREVMEELEELEKCLKRLLSQDGAIYFVDFEFFASMTRDLKQELRLARARDD